MPLARYTPTLHDMRHRVVIERAGGQQLARQPDKDDTSLSGPPLVSIVGFLQGANAPTPLDRSVECAVVWAEPSAKSLGVLVSYHRSACAAHNCARTGGQTHQASDGSQQTGREPAVPVAEHAAQQDGSFHMHGHMAHRRLGLALRDLLPNQTWAQHAPNPPLLCWGFRPELPFVRPLSRHDLVPSLNYRVRGASLRRASELSVPLCQGK